MKTIALRFADNFAPKEGTISAHKGVINMYGFVWYGKLGSKVSKKISSEILSNAQPRILLIHSGKAGRYWAYVEDIQFEIPDRKHIPEYYRDIAEKFSTWFKISRIEPALPDVVSKCKVLSSQRSLSEASRSSMSPYFIIDVE